MGNLLPLSLSAAPRFGQLLALVGQRFVLPFQLAPLCFKLLPLLANGGAPRLQCLAIAGQLSLALIKLAAALLQLIALAAKLLSFGLQLGLGLIQLRLLSGLELSQFDLLAVEVLFQAGTLRSQHLGELAALDRSPGDPLRQCLSLLSELVFQSLQPLALSGK